MLAIKFKRIGKKGQASFRVVVAQKRKKLQGTFVEDLGWFNPHTGEYNINKEHAKKWIGVGAQPTASVNNLLVTAGAIEGKKIPVHAKSKKKAVEGEVAAGMPVAAAPVAVAPTPAVPAETSEKAKGEGS